MHIFGDVVKQNPVIINFLYEVEIEQKSKEQEFLNIYVLWI